MKIVKHLLSVVTAVLLFVSCQKEYSLEGNNNGGMARGSLQDSAGQCQPIIVRGQYFTDSTLSDSNFILLQVRVTTAGNYVIASESRNGFSFRDSGYLSSTGWQTLKLKAQGRPIAAGTTDFTVTFDTASFCLFSVTVLQGTGGGNNTAVYTLQAGTGGSCSTPSIQGTYQTGTPLSNPNRIVLPVNVTTAGTWSVATTQQNGMTFAGSGTFPAAGSQTITLQGSGTPVTAGNSTIPVTAGATSCSFVVPVTQGTTGGGTNPNDADSAWEFTRGTRFLHGPLDYVDTATVPGLGFTLNIQGSTLATGDSLFVIALLMPGSTIQTGTFNTNNLASTNAAFYFVDYRGINPITLDSSTLGAAGSNVVINLSSYNATTKLVSGTFSGTTKTPAGTTITITGGKFAGKLD